MRKNLLLYILLIFLIAVNGFFLYSYLGGGDKRQQTKEHKPPEDFLAEQLNFDDEQKEAFNMLVAEHREDSRRISTDMRELKDELFRGLSDNTLKAVNRDSIATLIGEKQKQMELLTFNHFKDVQKLCSPEQMEKFSKIIKHALRRSISGEGPPPRERLDAERPAQPNGNDDDRPPPPRH